MTDPSHIPSPSLIDRFFFENPWPLMIGAGLVGLLLGWIALQRRNRRPAYAAVGALAIVGLAPLSAWLVVTAREAMIERTQRLVEVAVPPANIAELAPMIAEDVTVELPADRVMYDRRRHLIALAERASRKYKVEDYAIVQLDAWEIEPGRGEVLLSVTVELSQADGGIFADMEFNVPTQWLIEYRWPADDRQAMRVSRVIPLRLAGQEATRGQLP